MSNSLKKFQISFNQSSLRFFKKRNSHYLKMAVIPFHNLFADLNQEIFK